MTGEPDHGSPDHVMARAGLVLNLRQHGITDPDLLNAFEAVPHEVFVPEEYSGYAYREGSLPIACGQSITSPIILAMLIAALEPKGAGRALEVGTGSGYATALLAKFARRVFTLDRHGELIRDASARWSALGLHNIVGLHADGLSGWHVQAPFDRILLGGSVEEIPETLVDQLADGGLLVAPVGAADSRQTIVKIERVDDEFLVSEHGSVRLPQLVASKSRPL